MRIIIALSVLFSLVFLSFGITPAAASKSCWVDHYHHGSGSASSKNRARRKAIASWQGFTSWEYGKEWGYFSLAKNRRVKCIGSSGSFTCEASAIPCHER